MKRIYVTAEQLKKHNACNAWIRLFKEIYPADKYPKGVNICSKKEQTKYLNNYVKKADKTPEGAIINNDDNDRIRELSYGLYGILYYSGNINKAEDFDIDRFEYKTYETLLIFFNKIINE